MKKFIDIFFTFCCLVSWCSGDLVLAMTVEEAYRAIPHQRTVFDEKTATMNSEEKKFLRQFFQCIDLAIIEKVEMMLWLNSDGKQGRSASRYDAILQEFSQLSVPVSLEQAHASVVEAIKEQRQFLENWADRKDRQRPNFAQDPTVRSASQKLISAYQILIQVYPQETAQNKQAFFDYLCALDFL